MILWKAREDRIRDRAAKRLGKLDTISVIDWSESALNDLHRSLDALRHDVLDEYAAPAAEQAVSMLHGAVDVLSARSAAAKAAQG